MLDRHHLMILQEVARSGSVTAAADRLALSQSALSHTIRRLEERFGVEIWTRHGRALRLTQAGEHLLALARIVLPQFDHAERALADFAAGRRGLLRIGMECHPCRTWSMRVTPPFLDAWPEVDVEVRTGFRFDGIAALANHEIDLLVTPDPVARPGLIFRPVFDYHLVLVVAESHALAGRDHVDPSDLGDETLFALPVVLERLDVYTRFLLPAEVRPRDHRTVETTDLMLRLIAARRGVAVLPDWLVADEGAGLPLETLRLGPDGLAKSLHLGLRRGEETIDYVADFIRLAAA